MENYLNILHYCFYKAHYYSYLFNKKFTLSRLLFKIPLVKRKAEKEGVNLDESLNKAFGDKKFGLSTIVAGGILWGLIAIFFFSILIVFKIFVYATIPYIVACAVLSGAICYFSVFKDDKYIEYFNKYEKWTRAEKWKYSWLTLASIIAIFLLFYLGLKT